MQVQPYLFFDGNCEEAVEFYKRALGAEVQMLMRYGDAPPPPPEQANQCAGAAMPMTADKIIHVAMKIGDSMVLASDGPSQGKPNFRGFSLSLSPADVATGERLFAALSEGGQVMQPLMPTFFAKTFGMVTDRFGVGWMVVVS